MGLKPSPHQARLDGHERSRPWTGYEALYEGAQAASAAKEEVRTCIKGSLGPTHRPTEWPDRAWTTSGRYAQGSQGQLQIHPQLPLVPTRRVHAKAQLFLSPPAAPDSQHHLIIHLYVEIYFVKQNEIELYILSHITHIQNQIWSQDIRYHMFKHDRKATVSAHFLASHFGVHISVLL